MSYLSKEDQAASSRRHYEKNKDKIKARAVAFNKARSELLTEYVRKMKEAPCKDCGVSYPHYVMDFDHLVDKTHNVSNMVRSGYSLARVKTEIEKCELVCSNCHRERTWLRLKV